jgi:hypothetical protein
MDALRVAFVGLAPAVQCGVEVLLVFGVEPCGDLLSSRTAGHTTEDTKHTKNEALTKKAVLTHPAGGCGA